MATSYSRFECRNDDDGILLELLYIEWQYNQEAFISCYSFERPIRHCLAKRLKTACRDWFSILRGEPSEIDDREADEQRIKGIWNGVGNRFG
jgi:hypothetical protein